MLFSYQISGTPVVYARRVLWLLTACALVSCTTTGGKAPRTEKQAPGTYRQEAPLTASFDPGVAKIVDMAKTFSGEADLTTAPAPAFTRMKYTLYGDQYSTEIVMRQGNFSVVKTNGKYGEHYETWRGIIPLNSMARAGIVNGRFAPRRMGTRRTVPKVFEVKRLNTFSNVHEDGVSPRDLAVQYMTKVVIDGRVSTHRITIEPKRWTTQQIPINGDKYLLKMLQLSIRDEELDSRLTETALVDYVPMIGAAVSGNFMWYSWDNSRAVGSWQAWQIDVSPEVLDRVKQATLRAS